MLEFSFAPRRKGHQVSGVAEVISHSIGISSIGGMKIKKVPLRSADRDPPGFASGKALFDADRRAGGINPAFPGLSGFSTLFHNPYLLSMALQIPSAPGNSWDPPRARRPFWPDAPGSLVFFPSFRRFFYFPLYAYYRPLPLSAAACRIWRSSTPGGSSGD